MRKSLKCCLYVAIVIVVIVAAIAVAVVLFAAIVASDNFVYAVVTRARRPVIYFVLSF